MEYFQIMRSELELDVYCGDKCDESKPIWNSSCDGDMDSETHTDPIILATTHFPAGTKVTVSVPQCPECGLPRMSSGGQNEQGETVVTHEEKCDCGFDWFTWEQNEYS